MINTTHLMLQYWLAQHKEWFNIFQPFLRKGNLIITLMVKDQDLKNLGKHLMKI